MIFILTGIIAIYCLIILLLIVGFLKFPPQQSFKTTQKTTFSICIPFRNEAENLPALLQSLGALDYPENLFEIVLSNDHSTDDSLKIIADFCGKKADFGQKIRILNQKSASESGKKAALQLAIQHAKNKFIVTTDADCMVPKHWLAELNAFIFKQKKTFVAGPVALLETPNYFLNAFQQLDFLSLQGATIGAFGIQKPFLCNGANLAFAKAEFLRLNGYEGNTTIASGDDVFLMQKFLLDNPKNVGYLKSKKSIVKTQPQHRWHQLADQRRRWAAKASHYRDFTTLAVSWAVFLANFASILAVFYLKTSVFLSILVLLKIVVDFLLIAISAQFFGKKSHLSGYFWSFLVYPFFTVYIALSSQLQGFEWKGRRLKK